MTLVVIDTNVLVSAIIGHGKPRRLLRLVLRDHSAVASREMLAELADVLARDKFSLTPGQIARFLTIYAGRCDVVDLERRVAAVGMLKNESRAKAVDPLRLKEIWGGP